MVQRLEHSPHLCQNFDLKTFGLPPLYFLAFKFLFVNRLSKFFRLFLELKKMLHSHFAGDVSVQGNMQKRQFPKDGVRREAWKYTQYEKV